MCDESLYSEYEKALSKIEPTKLEVFDVSLVEHSEIKVSNYKNLVTLISNAKVEKPALHLLGLDNKQIKISLAPKHGRNAHHLYVNIGGDYYGKITPLGEYIYSSYNLVEPVSEPFIKGFLNTLNENPKQKIIENGKAFGICACCGLLLTNEESIQRGIGPVCFNKWRF